MKKRTDGRYQISLMIGYNDNGTPKRKVVYGKTQKEVTNKANELRMLHNMGVMIDSNIILGEWAGTWLKTYKSDVEYKTYQMYSAIVKNYIITQLGSMKLSDIKTAHLQKIVNENKHKAHTVRQFKLTISQIMEQAIVNDLIIKNPAKGLVLPVLETKRPKRALYSHEVEKIKTIKLNAQDKCFIYMLLYTGLRRGEALALMKSDIDINSMIITVNKALVFKNNQSEIKYNPKTKAGMRTIPILEPLKETLVSHIETSDRDLLFPSNSGGTMSEVGYRRMWERFCKAMGTKEITAHFFRHNFATILYNAGVDVKAAQAILGHSSISVTMDIYTHLNNQNKEFAKAKLNEFLTNND